MEYWNHNSTYYEWIDEKIGEKNMILDIGCGNGSLTRFLYEKNNRRKILGIDPSEESIIYAKRINHSIKYINTTFEEYQSKLKYDVIIFSASLHHLNMQKSLKKSRKLLNNNGIILIIGLAKPSNFFDYFVDLLRIIPCKIGSKIHNMKTSEELNVSTSYEFPSMNEVRKSIKTYFPNSKLRYGLYYRYLIIGKK